MASVVKLSLVAVHVGYTCIHVLPLLGILQIRFPVDQHAGTARLINPRGLVSQRCTEDIPIRSQVLL